VPLPTPIDALLVAPDRTTEQGRRDNDVLLFFYNTGARPSEAAAVAIRDLDVRSDGSGSVRLVGKGARRDMSAVARDHDVAAGADARTVTRRAGVPQPTENTRHALCRPRRRSHGT